MARTVVTPSNLPPKANRPWGLTVIKTAYTEVYPNASAESVLRNAKMVEEKILEKAKSIKDYDQSVSRAVGIIRSQVGSGNRDAPATEDNRTSTAGRTPKPKSRRNAPSATIARKNPEHDALRRVRMTNGIKSLTDPAKCSKDQKVSTRLHPSVASKIFMDGVTELGNLTSTKVDASDVIKLVPYILEAGVQVVGHVETVEKVQAITESEKTSIGFLGMEKMFRAENQNTGKGISAGSTSISKIQPLSARDKQQILCRAKRLRLEYLNSIRVIYAKLGEYSNTLECDDSMVLSIGESLKMLDELDGVSYVVSNRTVQALNYVERVFKTAIGQYGSLLKGGSFSGALKAYKSKVCDNGDGPSSATDPSGTYYGQANSTLGTVQNSRGQVFRSSRRIGGNGGDDDEDNFNRYRRSHYGEESTDVEVPNFAMLRQNYRAKIKQLIPLVEAELVSYADREQIRENIAYANAFLDLDNVTDKDLLQQTARIVRELVDRFCHLLQSKHDDTQSEIVEEKHGNMRPLPHKVARKTAPIRTSPPRRPAKMTASVSKIVVPDTDEDDQDEYSEYDEYDDYDEGYDANDELNDEYEEDQEGEEGAQERKIKINFSDSDDDEDCEDGDEVYYRQETRARVKINLASSDEDEEMNRRGPCYTEYDGEDDENEYGVEKDESELVTKEIPKEEEEVAKEEADVEQANEDPPIEEPDAPIETLTPRWSQRTSVVAARTSRAATPARSRTPGRNRTPARATTASLSSTTSRETRTTPGRVLRPRKTPRRG